MGFHLSFKDFGQQYAGLSKEDFFTRFPTPILVIDFEGKRDVPKDVETQEPPLRPAALTQFTPGHDEKLAQVVVAPLLKSDRNTMPGVVTLGRIEENDIVLPHGVISKLHAVFRKDPTTGVFSIVDAKSRYGTAVNGQNLPPGESCPLKTRTSLLFARFVLAEIFPPLEFYLHMHLMLHLGREK